MNVTKAFTHTCAYCGHEFTSNAHNARVCGNQECRAAHARNRRGRVTGALRSNADINARIVEMALAESGQTRTPEELMEICRVTDRQVFY